MLLIDGQDEEVTDAHFRITSCSTLKVDIQFFFPVKLDVQAAMVMFLPCPQLI
jgi:hypothetical protein